ncbi:MAG: transcriptional regulator [Candidatus Woesearchaeota archaeon]
MNYLPQEIEVWFVIPALRRDFAKIMKDEGLKQLEISKLLGITVPAVSQYITGKRGRDIIFPKEITIEIKKATIKIIKNKANFAFELQRICRLIRKKGYLCNIAKNYHVVNDNCNICMKN